MFQRTLGSWLVVGFSSVTARLGNEGQVDYTEANDMLGIMIQRYCRAHLGCTGKVMDWTA